ncbi:MAG: 6-bladed beta-propeller [Acidobacteriota bacterium]|jgi:hypothetical protein
MQELPSLSLHAVIGCEACDGPEKFADLNSVAIDSDGRVYVVDTFEPFVRIFEADGTFVRQFGTRGQGPGERIMPGWAFPGASGGVLVFDRMPARLQTVRFDPDRNELVTEESWTLPRRFFLAADYYPGGRYVYFFSPLAQHDGAMSVERWDLREGRGESVSTGSAYAANNVAMAAGSEDGFVVARRSSPRIDFFAATGSLANTIGPLADSDRDEVAASSRQYTGRFGIQVDDDGLLWVLKASEEEATNAVFQVFGSDRRLLGEIVVPAKVHGFVRAFDVSTTYLAAITLGAEQHVNVWRIDR